MSRRPPRPPPGEVGEEGEEGLEGSTRPDRRARMDKAEVKSRDSSAVAEDDDDAE